MSFEQALLHFVEKLQTEYGNKSVIKSIVLSDELYEHVEFECIKKAWIMPPEYNGKAMMIKFYCTNGYINIVKDSP